MITVNHLLILISKLVSINSDTKVVRYFSLTGHCAKSPISLNVHGVTIPGSVNYQVGQTYYFASKLMYETNTINIIVVIILLHFSI